MAHLPSFPRSLVSLHLSWCSSKNGIPKSEGKTLAAAPRGGLQVKGCVGEAVPACTCSYNVNCSATAYARAVTEDHCLLVD